MVDLFGIYRILQGDMFDYHAFVKMLKSGTKDDE